MKTKRCKCGAGMVQVRVEGISTDGWYWKCLNYDHGYYEFIKNLPKGKKLGVRREKARSR